MYMSVTLFWIAVYLRVLPYGFMTLQPQGFPIFPVDSCPRNISAVETATLRLNCSEVKEFKNVYHCLPLSNLSLLVEFCYDGVSGLIEKGNCMVLENQHLNNHPCTHFTNGCPEATYFPKNMFSFPSCMQINKQNSCYLADPKCPPVRGIVDTTTILMGENETATTNNSDDVKLSLAVLSPIIVISLIITLVVMWNRGRLKFCNKDNYSGLSEEKIPLKEKESKTYQEDENNLKRYKKYLEEGYTVVCPVSQVIIVGENGVGKTTLLNRLKGKTLKEIKDLNIKSTRGIECHTKKESFIISGNELKLNEDGISSLPTDLKLIKKSNKEHFSENPRIRHQQGYTPIATQTSEENNEVNTGDIRLDESKDEPSEVNEERILKAAENKREDSEMTGNMKDKQRDKGKRYAGRINDSYLKPNEENINDVSEDINNWIQNIKEELKNKEKRMTKFGSTDDVVLEVLDFAGQGVYYASHQTYIRRNAIFIVVVDISNDFNEKRNKNSGKRKDDHFQDLCDKPGVSYDSWDRRDYLFYWLNTIRTHGGNAKHILFVGTHKDQNSTGFDFHKVLNEAVKKKLLTKNYFNPVTTDLLNETDIEKDLQKVKGHICNIIKSCGREERPAKWIKYLNIFEIITLSNPLVEIEKLLGIADHFDPGMDDDEIDDMLHFFHNCGKIMFFNADRLKEIVILDIQWFVNCFKHIISDREHVLEDFKDLKDDTTNGEMVGLWNTFQKKGFLHNDLYHFLLNKNANKISTKQFDIIGEYQEKLGMMLHIVDVRIDEDEEVPLFRGWYVPCINSMEFIPNESEFGSENSSSILCFKFREYLPHDLFGRMIVLCLNSGYLQPYNYRLFKNGADMRFSHSDNTEEQIYIFHYKEFITVQFIGDNTRKNGPSLRQKLNKMIHKIISNFYSDALKYEVGFLCCKTFGYQEELVHHYVSEKKHYCQGCSRRISDVSERKKTFWFDVHDKQEEQEEPLIPNTHRKDYIRNICEIYSHVLKQSTGEKAGTRTEEKVISQGQGNETWLDELVEIGQTLKSFLRDRKLNEDEETEMKNIYSGLKKVSCCLNSVCKGLRKDIFFRWTQKMGSAQSDQDISMLSSETSDENVQIGTDVTIEVKAELVSHSQWLRKTCQEKKYRFLELIEEGKDKFDSQKEEDRLLLKIKNFDRQDTGSYYVVVETENGISVFRRTLRYGSPHRSGTIEEETKEENRITLERADEEEENDKMMNFRTLSGLEGRCSVKGVQRVAELKDTVAKALNSPKELIEIVDQKTVTLYHDDTEFFRFLQHEDHINVIERTKTREGRYQDVLEVENDSEDEENEIGVNEFIPRMHGCTHITNPDLLFNHIHRELLNMENTKVTCPTCSMEMETDTAFQMCDMSEDEKCFYREKIKMNRSWKHTLYQLAGQWSVMSESADNIVKP